MKLVQRSFRIATFPASEEFWSGFVSMDVHKAFILKGVSVSVLAYDKPLGTSPVPCNIRYVHVNFYPYTNQQGFEETPPPATWSSGDWSNTNFALSFGPEANFQPVNRVFPTGSVAGMRWWLGMVPLGVDRDLSVRISFYWDEIENTGFVPGYKGGFADEPVLSFR